MHFLRPRASLGAVLRYQVTSLLNRESPMMPKRNKKPAPPYDSKRSFPIDPRKLRAALDANAATIQEIAINAGIHRKTIYDIEARGAGRIDTLQLLACALGVSLDAIARDAAFSEAPEPSHRLVTPNNWELDGLVSPFFQAANGVTYRIATLRSSLDQGRVARGKFYDLLAVQPRKKEEMRAYLLRHSIVCRLVERSRWTPIHYDVRPLADETAWWVLDEWVPWPTLSELAQDQQLPMCAIKTIGSEILQGLAILHAHGVILRELAPERILVNEQTFECMLTDFELAKLIQGNVTVSGKWKCESPYRAPEIADEEPEVQCDVYSWSKVVKELLAGSAELSASDMKSLGFSLNLASCFQSCSRLDADERPRDVSKILKLWMTWDPS